MCECEAVGLLLYFGPWSPTFFLNRARFRVNPTLCGINYCVHPCDTDITAPILSLNASTVSHANFNGNLRKETNDAIIFATHVYAVNHKMGTPFIFVIILSKCDQCVSDALTDALLNAAVQSLVALSQNIAII